MNNKHICTLIRIAAEDYFKQWGEDYRGDYNDLKRIADILELGYSRSAYDIASNLDTFVQEAIPDEFWTIEK